MSSPGLDIDPPRYAADLRAAIAAAADPAEASAMARYMRDQFTFFGAKKAPRERAQKAFFASHGYPDAATLAPVVRALWSFDERECHYAALAILTRRVRPRRTPLVPGELLPLFEELVTRRSWWDTVDWIASKLVGWALRRDPTLRDPAITRWRQADDLWLRRTALIFQLGYKAETDAELLFELCAEQRHDRAFFIRKAIGWALREYSKTDGPAVVAFVEGHPDLSGLSRREALKWLRRKDRGSGA